MILSIATPWRTLFQRARFTKTLKYLSLIFIFSYAYASSCNRLLIEPQDGVTPILNSINQAKHSVDLVIYGLTRRDLRRALINAKQRGVKVRVILEKSPYKNPHENDYSSHRLRRVGIQVRSGSNDVALTHQKSLLIDKHIAWIMTMNFTYPGFNKQRNFAYASCNSDLLTEMSWVFNHDWQQKSVPYFTAQLVWSPINARDKLTRLINSAQHNIDIYALTLSDYRLIGDLARRAAHGIHVRIILPSNHNALSRGEKRYLTSHGVKLYFIRHLSQHAKLIIVDNQAFYLGSTNLSEASLDKNRELGIILYDKKLADRLSQQFNQDYQN